jgi:hypothetical protein
MSVIKQILETKKEYRRCLPADVGSHFMKIKHWIPKKEHKKFRSRMLESIKEGNAWMNEKVFLYYTREDARISHGVAIYGMDHPLDMLSLFISVFHFEDNDTAIMRFALHPGKFIQEYKSLLTSESIKRTHINPNHPLQIRVDAFRSKKYKMLAAGSLAK